MPKPFYQSTSWKTGLCVGLLAFVAFAAQPSIGQDDDRKDRTEQQIIQLIMDQSACWNKGDLEGFMETYWKSDKLAFSSGGQTVRGWNATLKRYRTNYDTAEKRGKLTFSELEVFELGPGSAYVLGRWHLKRTIGDVGGNFSLVWRRMDDGWRIVHDHTSTLEDPSGEDKNGSNKPK